MVLWGKREKQDRSRKGIGNTDTVRDGRESTFIVCLPVIEHGIVVSCNENIAVRDGERSGEQIRVER